MMSDPWVPSERLQTLAKMVCYDDLNPEEGAELETFLGDRRACRWYRDFCLFHTELRFLARAARADDAAHEQIRRNAARQASPSPQTSAPPTSGPLLPIVLEPSFSATQATFFAGWPIAYLVATVIVGVGLAIGAIVHVSQPGLYVGAPASVRAPNPQSPIPNPASIVGRISGMVDCVWAGEAGSGQGSAGANRRSLLQVGDRLAMKAGLLEITYDTGAKVVLQGPVTYEVDSPAGGYLSIGKLTARLERKGVERGKKGETANHKSEIVNRTFAVRTPTAVVTDLGTEFGVEVDKRGRTISHVFRGSVSVQATAADGQPRPAARVVHANETVEIGPDRGRPPTIQTATPDANRFVRGLPKRVRLALFNTGAGLKEGDPDPHWQIVAVSNDPKFRARPAVVSIPASNETGGWRANDPGRSQWISIVGDGSRVDTNVVYTFRTTFELAEGEQDTAAFRGWFIVDNHIRAIRLNGRELAVPEHDYGPRYDLFHGFTATKGFVAGTNVLELDAENGAPDVTTPNAMGLRLELTGSAIQNPENRSAKTDE